MMTDNEKENTGKVSRVTELGGREATVLENSHLRVMIDDIGGMVPELSAKQGKSRINAHWLPWFRSNSGKPFDAAEEKFWKANLLYHIAGNFPCVPNFGGGHTVDGIDMPPHGWTANLPWRFEKQGSDEQSGAVWALSSIESPEPKMPLSFKKIDALVPGQAVHYSALEIANTGKADLEITCGWHNVVGAPFLQKGCRISGAAERWSTAPSGGEFDETTRLALGAEFALLSAAPLSGGGSADISEVPGPLGYTDFACGVIPARASLGWSALVNPALKLAYICFFTGPGAADEDSVILRFNDLWMQYGGRSFTPWAPYEGAADLTYCLGLENAASAYANGLKYSRDLKQLMGAPTTVVIPAGKSRTLRYGVLFAPYEGDGLDGGIAALEEGEKALVCKGKNGASRFAADPEFEILKRIRAKI
jgi:hypothetical protein